MNFNWKEKKEVEIIAFLVGDRIFEPKISLEGFAWKSLTEWEKTFQSLPFGSPKLGYWHAWLLGVISMLA